MNVISSKYHKYHRYQKYHKYHKYHKYQASITKFHLPVSCSFAPSLRPTPGKSIISNSGPGLVLKKVVIVKKVRLPDAERGIGGFFMKYLYRHFLETVKSPSQ